MRAMLRRPCFYQPGNVRWGHFQHQGQLLSKRSISETDLDRDATIAPPSRSLCRAPCFSRNLSHGAKSRMVMPDLLWGTSCAKK